MDNGKIIGAGIAAGSIIVINGLFTSRNIARPIVGTFVATFLLAVMSAAGLAPIADNLAILLAGTIVVFYGADILGAFSKI